MTAIYALIKKDLTLFVGDRRALLLSLLMPILLGGFFGYLFGGGSGGDNSPSANFEIAVVQEDAHIISQKIVHGLKSETSLTVKELALEEAKELVRKGKLNLAIHIPNGFGESAGSALFGASNKPELMFYYDPSKTVVLAMAKGILTQHVMQAVSEEMFSAESGSQQAENQIENLQAVTNKTADQVQLLEFLESWKKYQTGRVQTASTSETGISGNAGLSTPFSAKEVAIVAGENKNPEGTSRSAYNGYAHSIAGMSVQFILFMAIDAGISILLARRLGLWNRLLASPVGLNTLLIARGLSCALIASTVMIAIFGVAALAFKVRILGSFIGFLAVVISFSLMTASFGLFTAAFGKTPEAARGIASFILLIMVMLSGAWMPAFLFPQWLQNLTLIVPTRWTMDGLDAMTWRGLDLTAALPSVAVQLLFTLLLGALAVRQFNRQ